MIRIIAAFVLISISTWSQDTLRVYFESGSHELSQTEQNELNSVDWDWFSVLSIEGHCDIVGKDLDNKALADRRIAYVSSLLKLSDDIERKSFGESEAKNDLDYKASEWRRVDIIYRQYVIPAPEAPEKPNESGISREFDSFINDSTSNETTVQLSILFISNSNILVPESEPELDELYRFLHANPSVTAHIEGHVCCGDDFPLSLDRAYMVKHYLVKRAINPARLTYEGFSNTKPLVWPEVTAEDRKRNRRVSIVFKKH